MPRTSMMGVTQSQNSLVESRPGSRKITTTKAMEMLAKAQWTRASLKKAIRPPTTREPTAPQARLTSTRASIERRLNSRAKKLPGGARSASAASRRSSQFATSMFAPPWACFLPLAHLLGTAKHPEQPGPQAADEAGHPDEGQQADPAELLAQ